MVEAATTVMTSRICSLVKPAARNASSSGSLRCPRFSMSVFARVETAPNRRSLGTSRARAGVRDCVSQENDLNLLLGEAAAVYLLKHGSEGGKQLGRI